MEIANSIMKNSSKWWLANKIFALNKDKPCIFIIFLCTVNWKVGLTQKKMQKCRYCFKHPYKRWDWPFKFFFISLFSLSRYLRSKEANMQKSWNLAKQKLSYYTNFFKLEYLLLWPMVNFPLKVAQIWYLLFEIKWFEATALKPWTLESQMTNIKFDLL